MGQQTSINDGIRVSILHKTFPLLCRYSRDFPSYVGKRTERAASRPYTDTVSPSYSCPSSTRQALARRFFSTSVSISIHCLLPVSGSRIHFSIRFLAVSLRLRIPLLVLGLHSVLRGLVSCGLVRLLCGLVRLLGGYAVTERVDKGDAFRCGRGRLDLVVHHHHSAMVQAAEPSSLQSLRRCDAQRQ